MAFSCSTFSEESSILDVWKCFKYPFIQNSTLKSRYEKYVNQFHATDFFWYALKTSEDPWFSDVFRGYQKRSVAWNGLRIIIWIGNYWKLLETIAFWKLLVAPALREKRPNTEFFWSVFSCIPIWKKSVFGNFSRSAANPSKYTWLKRFLIRRSKM